METSSPPASIVVDPSALVATIVVASAPLLAGASAPASVARSVGSVTEQLDEERAQRLSVAMAEAARVTSRSPLGLIFAPSDFDRGKRSSRPRPLESR